MEYNFLVLFMFFFSLRATKAFFSVCKIKVNVVVCCCCCLILSCVFCFVFSNNNQKAKVYMNPVSDSFLPVL